MGDKALLLMKRDVIREYRRAYASKLTWGNENDYWVGFAEAWRKLAGKVMNETEINGIEADVEMELYRGTCEL